MIIQVSYQNLRQEKYPDRLPFFGSLLTGRAKPLQGNGAKEPPLNAHNAFHTHICDVNLHNT